MKLLELFEKVEEHLKNNNSFLDLKPILEEYNDKDWEKYVIINEDKYNRIKLFENEYFEVLLLVWNKNQRANIHDHSENGCWLKLLKGQLNEKIYDSKFKIIENNVINEKDIGFMINNKGYHSIHNINEDDISVSLHIYSPPNHKTKYFF